MSSEQTWGRDATRRSVKRHGNAAFGTVLLVCLFAAAIVLLFSTFMRSSIVTGYFYGVGKSTKSLVRTSVPFKFDEMPFVHLKRRHRHTDGKRDSTDDWVMYGVARYGAPSFYVGFWDSKRRSPVRYDVKRGLKKYKTLGRWGTVEPEFYSKMVTTQIGRFELLRFKYSPPSSVQQCIYYSSIDLPQAIYLRGHYCSVDRTETVEARLMCSLSGIKHPALPISEAVDRKNCPSKQG